MHSTYAAAQKPPCAVATMNATLTQGDAFPASCSQCSAALGAVPVRDAPSAAQLLQTSVVPVPRTLSYTNYFSEILANYLVEQADRHAVHHFLIQALGAEPQPRLLVWVFQPIVEVCTTQRMAVCKILYHTSTAPPQVPYHPLTLPAAQCDLLAQLLIESNALYPAARKKLAQWHVGFLLRTLF